MTEKWQCQSCSAENPMSLRRCICGKSRPAPSISSNESARRRPVEKQDYNEDSYEQYQQKPSKNQPKPTKDNYSSKIYFYR